ncbi:MAG: carbohydrate ABC transporter permease [Fusobacteriota bacterium]
MKFRLKRESAPYFFISPFYILFAIFGAFPILFSLFLSFHRWDGIAAMEWVGIENYSFVLTDPWFWKSIMNVLIIFVMTTIPQHLIALVFAYILYSGTVKFREFFRGAFFLPYITSAVAVSMIFRMLYGEHYGVLNALLEWFSSIPGVSFIFEYLKIELPIKWLTNSAWVKPSIAILVTWKYTGWNLILYYAALQNIPGSLYEAARVDGATPTQTFFHITIPMLKPVIFFAVTMSIIGNLQLFAEPYMLTTGLGGPSQAGLTPALYLYTTGFKWGEFGTGSAMAYILCALIIVISLINKYIFKEKKEV